MSVSLVNFIIIFIANLLMITSGLFVMAYFGALIGIVGTLSMCYLISYAAIYLLPDNRVENGRGK